ncbi:MAG: Dam family site-specific DNA-(adenine-N6)-methyltransferase [Azonexus sp.]
MKITVPHPIPYQGSKRNLADIICGLFPKDVETLFEPFAGSAAITLYAARHGLAQRFVIGDSLPELIELWRAIIEEPDKTAARYETIWLGHIEGGADYFNRVRERFNNDRDPVELLYLVARCVKNAVRFNRHGRFTQSADKRRLGTQPAKMTEAIKTASHFLKGRTELYCGDFIKTISAADKRDLVYMDPPYHGTTYGRDKRYFAQIERETLTDGIEDMNRRAVRFLLSYDGMSGDTVYGEPLPDNLGMRRLLLEAGRSSQATLNGKNAVTIESLYVSSNLSGGIRADWRQRSEQIEILLEAA